MKDFAVILSKWTKIYSFYVYKQYLDFEDFMYA